MTVIDELIARGVIIIRNKQVHVCKYTRTRFGNKEYVREHWRSWPCQRRIF